LPILEKHHTAAAAFALAGALHEEDAQRHPCREPLAVPAPLSNRVFETHDAIPDAACEAWNAILCLASQRFHVRVLRAGERVGMGPSERRTFAFQKPGTSAPPPSASGAHFIDQLARTLRVETTAQELANFSGLGLEAP
jgi:hypothetical protein